MKFALAGNPNSGKTTLFNALTGSTAHVGNWPGVTVDRREGLYKSASGKVSLVDLPGIYSLSPYTPEEVVSRNYILDGEPDLVIDIVDATNLERNLYLTTQILEADLPVVVALNMMDVVEKDGGKVDVALLAERLGVPVVPISALRGEGIANLMEVAWDAAKRSRAGRSPLEFSSLAPALSETAELFRRSGVTHPVFHAVKALEGDLLESSSSARELAAQVAEIRGRVELDAILEGDFEAAVADIRYKYITAHCKPAMPRPAPGGLTRSDRIDAVLTHRLFGIPIFLLFIFLVFHLTFADPLMLSERFTEGGVPSPGVLLQGWMEWLTEGASGAAAGFLEAAGASGWVSGLVVDGLLGGVGAVLSFLPQIMMLFFFLSVMEDTGYMARAAFLMDQLLRRFGLSGRAFLPLLMGFGCSVPAMMGSRTLADERERRMTIMLMPFFSCGAKLPIWSMFAAAIFPAHADKAVFGIYIIGILAAVVTAIILKTTVLKGAASVFIMELPTYRMPQPKNLALHLWEKLKGFVMRATTIIAGATVAIWFLSNFDFDLRMVGADGSGNILAVLGTLAVPFFKPLGFAASPDAWKAVVAIMTGLLAKEMVVSTLGVFYAPDAGALADGDAANALGLALVAAFSPAAALSFMTFNLLSIPCMAAVATANAELRSARWTWGAIGFWILTAWAGSFIVYRVSGLFL